MHITSIFRMTHEYLKKVYSLVSPVNVDDDPEERWVWVVFISSWLICIYLF